MWGRAPIGNHATAWPLEFCPGGRCPLALALIVDTSISPLMPLVSFQLLPWCWSPEGVSLCKSQVHCGPFQGRHLRILQFLLPPQPHHGFLQPEVMGAHLPDAGTLGRVVWCGAGIPHSRFLSTTHGCGIACSTSPCLSTPFHVSASPTRQDECGFLNSLDVGLPYSSIFWQFWVIFAL